MRVLIVHSTYLSGSVSGENRVVGDEARLLAEGGHDVRVWDPAPREARGPGLLRTALKSVWSGQAVRHLKDLVASHRSDVVHFHNLFPMVSPAAIRAVSDRAPAVITLHNYRLLCLPATFLRDGKVCEDCLGHIPWRGVVYRCYRDSTLGSATLATSLSFHRALKTFDQVTLFLAGSSFVRDKHVDAGVPEERIRIKRNFSWATARRTDPGDYFLYLGRISPEKGVQNLVKAWHGAPGRLLVVGDGPGLEELKNDAAPTVEFTGAVPPETVAEILAHARALMVPSLTYESAPRAVLEAYAAGVPVIASRLGALPEVVDHDVSGLLVDPHDAEAWTAAAASLLDDDKATKLGEGAWQRWRIDHSPEQGRVGLESAYEEAVART